MPPAQDHIAKLVNKAVQSFRVELACPIDRRTTPASRPLKRDLTMLSGIAVRLYSGADGWCAASQACIRNIVARVLGTRAPALGAPNNKALLPSLRKR